MIFEWDEYKRRSNLIKHELDFKRGADLFDGRPQITTASFRNDEARYKTTGEIDGKTVTLIWTQRREKVRFISLRSARDGEKRRYQAVYP